MLSRLPDAEPHSGVTPTSDAPTDDTVRLTVPIPAALHARIKIAAVIRGETMGAMLTALFTKEFPPAEFPPDEGPSR